ncbi:MAG: glucokinase, partial [Pseudomonadota bacterium]
MLSLIADVGGTNTRLAWAKGNTFEQVKIVPTAAATNFLDIVDDYLQERRVVDAEIHAAFAVAGPVRDGEARLTNEAVSISASELHSRFGFANVAILNDFAALAYALPHLSGAHCLQVGGGQARLDEPKLVLGPGTGFGTSLW